MCPIECSPDRLEHVLHTANPETSTTRRLMRLLFSPAQPLVALSRAGGGIRDREPDIVKGRVNGLGENRVRPRSSGQRGDDAAKGEWFAVLEVTMGRCFLSGSYWHIIYPQWQKAGDGGRSARD